MKCYGTSINIKGSPSGQRKRSFVCISPVENKNDLELDFKVFFFTDSCCSDIVDDESR